MLNFSFSSSLHLLSLYGVGFWYPFQLIQTHFCIGWRQHTVFLYHFSDSSVFMLAWDLDRFSEPSFIETFCFYGFDGTERAWKHDSFHLCIDVYLGIAPQIARLFHDGTWLFLTDNSYGAKYLTAKNSIFKDWFIQVTKNQKLLRYF